MKELTRCNLQEYLKPTEEESCSTNVLACYDYASSYTTVIYLLKHLGYWHCIAWQRDDNTLDEYIDRIIDIIYSKMSDLPFFYIK